MIIHIPEKSRAKSRKKKPDFIVYFGKAQVDWKEKKLNQQFLKIIIVTVPELEDRLGEKRFVRVPKNIKPEKAKAANDAVSQDGEL